MMGPRGPRVNRTRAARDNRVESPFVPMVLAFDRVTSHLRELYRHRVLIETLVRREVKARYRGSVLGYAWTLLNPVSLVVVYHLVFRRFTHAVALTHYPAFLFVGMLPWLWIASSVSSGAMAIVAGASLVTKVGVPPHVLPTVQVIANLVNVVLGLPVAMVALAYAGVTPSASLALLPLVLALELAFLYGVTLLLATLSVPYRDVQFLVQNALSLWFLLTPVAYPLKTVPGRYGTLLALNPATSFVVSFQQILFDGRAPDGWQIGAAAAWSALSVLGAIVIYESMRNRLTEQL
jgi:lipopolysaccharide transport system permease protein